MTGIGGDGTDDRNGDEESIATDGGDDTAAPDGGEETVVRRDRFSGGPARGFLSSLEADERIFEADLAVDRAHTIMLAEQDIIADADAAAILDALDAVEDAGHGALPPGEDVHEAIESAVIDRVGPEGGRMHTARSRNDEVAACIRYRLRSDLLDAIEATIELREILLEVAAEHTGTVMPGYTHLQPAQPTTVGHYLCSYAEAVARDTDRLLEAFARTNRSPLGAAAFAGTPFDVDRERTAELLGFDGLVENSMDASSTRDFLAEATAALSIHATTLSGLAEDLIVFSNKGLVELDDAYSSTSSIMPQKKNPDTLELVRAVAGDSIGELSGLLSTLKGLPRAYNRDLQRATPHGWRTIDATVEATSVAAGAVATATWNEDGLAAAAGEGFSTATGVADLLAMAGIPFRTAHEVVAAAATVETAEAAEMAEGDVGVEELETAAQKVLGESLFEHVDRSAVQAALDPHESVASRDSVGGPAPAAVAATIETAEAELETDRDRLETHHGSIADADRTLRTAVTRYV